MSVRSIESGKNSDLGTRDFIGSHWTTGQRIDTALTYQVSEHAKVPRYLGTVHLPYTCDSKYLGYLSP